MSESETRQEETEAAVGLDGDMKYTRCVLNFWIAYVHEIKMLTAMNYIDCGGVSLLKKAEGG